MPDEARAKAVEAAYRAACTAYVRAHDGGVPLRAAITAYLAAMRAQGWVMTTHADMMKDSPHPQ